MIDEHGYPCTKEKSSLMMLALGSSLMLRYSFAECFCPEKELERLLRRAVGENPCSERLKEALIKQSWDGNITFCMSSEKEKRRAGKMTASFSPRPRSPTRRFRSALVDVLGN